MSKMWWCGVFLMIGLGGCGSDGKPYGAPCTQSNQCASNSCFGPPAGPKTCGCATTSDCPSGMICLLTTDTGRRCEPAPDAAVAP